MSSLCRHRQAAAVPSAERSRCCAVSCCTASQLQVSERDGLCAHRLPSEFSLDQELDPALASAESLHSHALRPSLDDTDALAWTGRVSVAVLTGTARRAEPCHVSIPLSSPGAALCSRLRSWPHLASHTPSAHSLSNTIATLHGGSASGPEVMAGLQASSRRVGTRACKAGGCIASRVHRDWRRCTLHGD